MRNIYTVYILRCADGSYYTGMTSTVEDRMLQHHQGIHKDAYTASRCPLSLVYTAEFQEVFDAIAWERQIKRWSRKKKEALIHNDSNTLHFLSQRRTTVSHISKICIKNRERYRHIKVITGQCHGS